MVRLLLYAVKSDNAGTRIQDVLQELVSEQHLEVHRSVESLRRRLHMPRESLRIVILVPPTQEELLGMVSLRQLLKDYRIVLFLPDDSRSTVAWGLSLCPRFLAHNDIHSRDLMAVLDRMLRIYATDSWAVAPRARAGGERS
jgi:hypothetical protein